MLDQIAMCFALSNGLGDQQHFTIEGIIQST